ncbi:MAG TPA: hypothetical protein VGH16_12675 [Candidatus Binatia bacterium]
METGGLMKRRTAAAAALSILIFPAVPVRAADNGMSGMDMPAASAPKSSHLQPAEGASVKIVTPKNGQEFKGDQIPLEFKLTKGKRGDHVHAYVDGELMGMFSGEKGTLTGIKPGKHELELRVVTTDHTTELKATDRTDFVVK